MAFTVKDILRLEVAPALGCTEPVAIALGAAAAASLLPGKQIDAIEIWVDPNIYKNGIAVSIPGTPGLSGIDTAGAIGALGGDPGLGLEVLDSVDDRAVADVQKYLKEGRVKVNLLSDHKGLMIKTSLKSGSDTAESLIQDLHDNIVSLTLNGKEDSNSPLLSSAAQEDGKSDVNKLESWLKELSLSELLELGGQMRKDKGI